MRTVQRFTYELFNISAECLALSVALQSQCEAVKVRVLIFTSPVRTNAHLLGNKTDSLYTMVVFAT